MTIYTLNSGSEKKDATDTLGPVVVRECAVPLMKTDEASVAVVALTPPQRRNNLASICVLLTALIVFAIGILGGIFLYNKLAHRKYQGWCGVSYYESQLEGYVADKSVGYPGDHRYYGQQRGEFEEHVELDRDQGRYEKIDVPEFGDSQKATILHDFDKNFTAIVDKDNERCFIIPLNRSMVKPPKDFWDLLTKLRSGYYLPDTEIVRENYQVITPQVENVHIFGYYIWKECQYLDTFKMVREGDPVALARRKRSVADCKGLANNQYLMGATGMSRSLRITITHCIN